MTHQENLKEKCQHVCTPTCFSFLDKFEGQSKALLHGTTQRKTSRKTCGGCILARSRKNPREWPHPTLETQVGTHSKKSDAHGKS